ncbi:MAG: delta-class carbonic anhydrase [Pseudomonadota bacterium]
MLGAESGTFANDSEKDSVDDRAIAEQRKALAGNTMGQGFGPQSPRDIDAVEGSNDRVFEAAPGYNQMNLCNIHFHKNAEHKGIGFSKYVGNGDGDGNGTGYAYSGTLSEKELSPITNQNGDIKNNGLRPGDTIEVHYVHTTAQVTPGPTLKSCLSNAIKNPQLRVETQVYVLVNDMTARDFAVLNHVKQIGGLFQAPNIPKDTGQPVQYAGSTTGPSYNEAGSPFQVTWSVRPVVAKVNIHTVNAWLNDNIFEEDHAHGVRNLIKNPDLLSRISR